MSWRYNSDKTSIYRLQGSAMVSYLVDSPEAKKIMSENEIDQPLKPVEPRPSLADRVEAAETIIDLLLMEGE